MTTQHIKYFLIGLSLALGAGLAINALRTAEEPAPAPVPGTESGGPLDYLFTAMGGVPVQLRVWDRDPRQFITDCDESEKLVEEIEREVSSWRPESVTTRINTASPGETVELPERLNQIMVAAFRLNELSGNAFNPTIGPLIELWKEAARRGAAPTAEELGEVREGSEIRQHRSRGFPEVRDLTELDRPFPGT